MPGGLAPAPSPEPAAAPAQSTPASPGEPRSRARRILIGVAFAIPITIIVGSLAVGLLGYRRTGGAPEEPAGPPPRAELLEEDRNEADGGRRFDGTVTWRTEPAEGGLAAVVEVTIPDRQMTMTLSIRRNTDSSLPASHIILVTFDVPQGFLFGTVANMPNVRMSPSIEDASGALLAGLSVRVTVGSFLVGLSEAEFERKHNLELLMQRPVIKLMMNYGTGGRAIMAIEKGAAGERAFAAALGAGGS
jgi:hypothetical protein